MNDALENPYSDLPLYPTPPLDTALGTEWERMPLMLGRWRDVLSQASNPENVVLMVEQRTIYVRWSVSPPTLEFTERSLVEETIQISASPRGPDYEKARDAAVAEGKERALAAYAAWCAEQTP